MNSRKDSITKKEQAMQKLLTSNKNNCPCCKQLMLQAFPAANCSDDHRLCFQCLDAFKNMRCPQCHDANPDSDISPPTNKSNLPPCRYATIGCSYVISHDIADHESECKFRNYICLGRYMGTFPKCKWTGKQEAITKHFEDDHKENIGNMSYKYTGIINLHKKCDIQLFDAHNKKFIFVYERKSTLPCNSFLYIACMGTQKQAKRFCYEFEFYKPGDAVTTLKFRLFCVSDAVLPAIVVQNHQCVFLCNNSLKNFFSGDHLNYRFWIKQTHDVISAKVKHKN